MTVAYEIVDQTAQSMGCELLQISCGGPLAPVAWRRERLDPGGEAGANGVGAIGRLSTLRWSRPLDHGESGLTGGLAARGRHRLSLPSAPLSGAGRAAGAVPILGVDHERDRVATGPVVPAPPGEPRARWPWPPGRALRPYRGEDHAPSCHRASNPRRRNGPPPRRWPARLAGTRG